MIPQHELRAFLAELPLEDVDAFRRVTEAVNRRFGEQVPAADADMLATTKLVTS